MINIFVPGDTSLVGPQLVSFVSGQTAQSLTCSIMEKPHTGLDHCLRMLLPSFRKRTSAGEEKKEQTHPEKSSPPSQEGTELFPPIVASFAAASTGSSLVGRGGEAVCLSDLRQSLTRIGERVENQRECDSVSRF